VSEHSLAKKSLLWLSGVIQKDVTSSGCFIPWEETLSAPLGTHSGSPSRSGYVCKSDHFCHCKQFNSIQFSTMANYKTSTKNTIKFDNTQIAQKQDTQTT
jgi:hypothetical protein